MIKLCKKLALVGMILFAAFASTQAADGGGVVTEILLKTTASWDGDKYVAYPAGQPELTIARIVFPANAELAWHTHPMPNAAYVVRGELTVVRHPDGKTVTRIGGQTLPETVGTLHRGRSGPDPVELLVFYAGTPGMPYSETHSVSAPDDDVGGCVPR